MASYDLLTAHQAHAIADMVKEALRRSGLSLSAFAREAGVAQSMAHNVVNAKVRRRTPNLRRLELYVHISLGKRDSLDVAALDADVFRFIRAGGDVEMLRALVRALASNLALDSEKAPK